MTAKTKIIGSIVVIAIAFASGRYSAPVKIKTVTQTVEVDKKQEKEHENKDIHKTITKTQTKAKDGTVTIITTTKYDSNTLLNTAITDTSTSSTSTEKEIVKDSQHLTIAALAGVNLNNSQIVYGAHVQKEILGPISIGLFGFTSSTCGGSVGLRF